jgi:hypothetical protein
LQCRENFSAMLDACDHVHTNVESLHENMQTLNSQYLDRIITEIDMLTAQSDAVNLDADSEMPEMDDGLKYREIMLRVKDCIDGARGEDRQYRWERLIEEQLVKVVKGY